MTLKNYYINTKISDLLIEGSGKCQKIKNCEYLCKNTFKKLNQEDGIKQLVICVSDYLSCHPNKNFITLN